MSGMSRVEHLAWCKKRALEYVDAGDLVNAVTSMGSDLNKHPELGANPFLVMAGAAGRAKGDAPAVRRWIEGFR